MKGLTLRKGLWDAAGLLATRENVMVCLLYDPRFLQHIRNNMFWFGGKQQIFHIRSIAIDILANILITLYYIAIMLHKI